MNKSVEFVTLIILDGWGLAEPSPGNAISLASTPNMDGLWASFLKCHLAASGSDVGLPPGEMGNSEVGHMNLGAGRVVYQDLLRINTAIADGSFFEIETLIEAVERAKRMNKSLHLLGLVSSGDVHASMEHLFSLLRLAKEHGLEKVYVHVFTDGRDTPPQSSPVFLAQLEQEMMRLGVGQIASVMGRYYAMDRDLRWKRTQLAYDALTLGEGNRAKTAREAVEHSYQENRTDEFIEPAIILNPDGTPVALINDGDAVIFFNFRTDRPKQLTAAFVYPDFESREIRPPAFDPYLHKYKTPDPETLPTVKTFVRKRVIKDLYFVTLTEYDKKLPARVGFSTVHVDLPLGRVLAEHDLSQFRLAETEKYPHATYFFSGGREKPFPGEVRMIIPSPKVSTYDLQPEMSAREVSQKLIKRIRLKTEKFFLVNFANPDMVGHTGVIPATVKACEVVDECLGRIVKEIMLLGGACIVTADHGNAEIMLTETGGVETEHSSSPVPCIFIHERFRGRGEVAKGRLADVAPSVLSLLGTPVPSVMTGRNLLDTHL